MGLELVERVCHVPVAQVPGRCGTAEHRAVVLLGVGDHGRVLLGEEVAILGDEPVTPKVVAGAAAQLDELFEHAPPARLADAEQHGPSVAGAVSRERMQALVAAPRARGRAGIDLLEVGDHGLHRGTQAV